MCNNDKAAVLLLQRLSFDCRAYRQKARREGTGESLIVRGRAVMKQIEGGMLRVILHCIALLRPYSLSVTMLY